LTEVFDRYQMSTRLRYQRAARANRRLDIQGLRMIAILSVLACHLWHWPRGGYVGVDVFFVIAGYLVTAALLHSRESDGGPSLRTYYWNRFRRIVPAATLVLVLTYFASVLAFTAARAHQIGIDALFAAVFAVNWRFAALGAAPSVAAGHTTTPLLHYWAVSVAEQFYLVWPAVIVLLGGLAVRRSSTHGRRVIGAIVGAVVVGSFAWAAVKTGTHGHWTYFDTVARLWEFGVGALLAVGAGVIARIPLSAKPFLSWGGLGLIAASLFLIGENSREFPVPWALLPVAGAALVIAAGVDGEPGYQDFLRNPASTYLGDLSYSLYLVHWPVIVILGALMKPSWAYYLSAVALMFALSIGVHHFVELPLRNVGGSALAVAGGEVRQRSFSVSRSNQLAGLAAAGLLAVAGVAYGVRPAPEVHASATKSAPATARVGPEPVGPQSAALRTEIEAALKAGPDWPKLDPTMESVIAGPADVPEIAACADPNADGAGCTWGNADAPTRIVVVGDSVGLNYVGPLRDIALKSNGQLQVHSEAMPGCTFAADLIADDAQQAAACPARKQRAVDYITTNKPAVVIIANAYGDKTLQETGQEMEPEAWSDSMHRIVDQLRGSVGKIVFLAAPPADRNPADCFGRPGSSPFDCISTVSQTWRRFADQEKRVASDVGGVWIDSRPWFCANLRFCPGFVGTTPTKYDAEHMSSAYGLKIAPVIAESLRAAGVLP